MILKVFCVHDGLIHHLTNYHFHIQNIIQNGIFDFRPIEALFQRENREHKPIRRPERFQGSEDIQIDSKFLEASAEEIPKIDNLIEIKFILDN